MSAAGALAGCPSTNTIGGGDSGIVIDLDAPGGRPDAFVPEGVDAGMVGPPDAFVPPPTEARASEP